MSVTRPVRKVLIFTWIPDIGWRDEQDEKRWPVRTARTEAATFIRHVRMSGSQIFRKKQEIATEWVSYIHLRKTEYQLCDSYLIIYTLYEFYFLFQTSVFSSFSYCFFTAAHATLWVTSSREAPSLLFPGSEYSSQRMIERFHINLLCMFRQVISDWVW